MIYAFSEKTISPTEKTKSLCMKVVNKSFMSFTENKKILFLISKYNNKDMKIFLYLDLYNYIFPLEVKISKEYMLCSIKTINLIDNNKNPYILNYNSMKIIINLDKDLLKQWSSIINLYNITNEKNILYIRKVLMLSIKKKLFFILEKISNLEQKMIKFDIINQIKQNEDNFFSNLINNYNYSIEINSRNKNPKNNSITKDKLKLESINKNKALIKEYIDTQFKTIFLFLSELIEEITNYFTNIKLVIDIVNYFFLDINFDSLIMKRKIVNTNFCVSLNMLNYFFSFEGKHVQNLIKKVDDRFFVFMNKGYPLFEITNNEIKSRKQTFSVSFNEKEDAYYIGEVKNNLYDGKGILYCKGKVYKGVFCRGKYSKECEFNENILNNIKNISLNDTVIDGCEESEIIYNEEYWN